eukprot:15467226-Alexandrium_andersonii.AAC.1
MGRNNMVVGPLLFQPRVSSPPACLASAQVCRKMAAPTTAHAVAPLTLSATTARAQRERKLHRTGPCT